MRCYSHIQHANKVTHHHCNLVRGQGKWKKTLNGGGGGRGQHKHNGNYFGTKGEQLQGPGAPSAAVQEVKPLALDGYQRQIVCTAHAGLVPCACQDTPQACRAHRSALTCPARKKCVSMFCQHEPRSSLPASPHPDKPSILCVRACMYVCKGFSSFRSQVRTR